MKIYLNPPREDWEALSARATAGNAEIEDRVRGILERVRREGDEALKDLAQEIDGVDLSSGLEVTPEEFAEAEAAVSPEVKKAVEEAYANIHKFHSAQMPAEIRVETAPGVVCTQRPVPIAKVGLYIPGGTAPLFSTVLMLAVPALIAGCRERVLCSPCGKDGRIAPEVLYAARRCGIRKVFKAGGAQAVGAMAFGTESVPRVDKIFGPGNRYVMTAKQIVSGECTAIDMPAGPSEVMVIASSDTNPVYAAADLLSQAEHGRDSQVILVCPSAEIAERVVEEVGRQAAQLSRGAFIASSLENSRAIVFDNQEDIVDFANCYAPEHLIISTLDCDAVADRIYAAGSVFLGAWTPESAGDYASGTNHTLPTSGWARSFSGVNIDSFMRKMTLQKISREGLQGLSQTIVTMAEAEGLEAHANAVKVRL